MNVTPYNLKRHLGIPQVEGISTLASYNVAHWQDHLRMSHAQEETGGFIENPVMLVSEPYAISADAMAEILAFCRDHHLNVFVDSHSKHNPGQCCRIMLWKRDT